MNLAELILAAALITGSGPAEWKEPAALKAQFPTLRFSLMSLALEWELLDPRETRYKFSRAEDLACDPVNDLFVLHQGADFWLFRYAPGGDLTPPRDVHDLGSH